MNRMKGLLCVAGAALGLSSLALAQSANDQYRALDNELTADSRARSSQLLQDDGLEVGGYTQIRYAVNSRDQAPATSEDLTQSWSIRRAKIWIEGPIAGATDWDGRIVGAFASGGGGMVLDDCWVRHTFEEGWSIVAGQFKQPWMFEESMSAQKLLFADRSMVNEAFNQGRSQGLMFQYTAEQFMFSGAWTDGFGGANTDFSGNVADFALSARGDFIWQGDPEVFQDATSWKGSEYAGRAGAAVVFMSGGSTAVGVAGKTTDADAVGVTGDVSVEGDGFNLFGAAVFTNIDPAGGTDTSDLGFMAQGGWFASDDFELIGGLDVIIPEDDVVTTSDPFVTVRAGVNHYIVPNSHSAKLTAQVGVHLDNFSHPTTIPAIGGGAGVFGTGSGIPNAVIFDGTGDPQIVFILQGTFGF